PIPNRTVKRLSADDSVHSHVKVGHRQALQFQKTPLPKGRGVFYCLKHSLEPPIDPNKKASSKVTGFFV
ncbi:hypothetical protein, partial [Limnobacter alexandrii]|uniref:hypothetical protein n=1 Tax=Limnobacter alexandrii TaxID=2570352 RepID=UPI001BB0DEA8